MWQVLHRAGKRRERWEKTGRLQVSGQERTQKMLRKRNQTKPGSSAQVKSRNNQQLKSNCRFCQDYDSSSRNLRSSEQRHLIGYKLTGQWWAPFTERICFYILSHLGGCDYRTSSDQGASIWSSISPHCGMSRETAEESRKGHWLFRLQLAGNCSEWRGHKEQPIMPLKVHNNPSSPFNASLYAWVWEHPLDVGKLQWPDSQRRMWAEEVLAQLLQ